MDGGGDRPASFMSAHSRGVHCVKPWRAAALGLLHDGDGVTWVARSDPDADYPRAGSPRPVLS